MKTETQQIAIAKACGIVTSDQWGPLYKTAFGLVRVCPDYLNDLNAMHEAEKLLNVVQIAKYLGHLYSFTEAAKPESCPWTVVSARVAAHATAAQRAEAFLRTLGKWEDGK
jgi:hypothetical protein